MLLLSEPSTPEATSPVLINLCGVLLIHCHHLLFVEAISMPAPTFYKKL